MKQWMVWSIAALLASAGCSLLVVPRLTAPADVVQKIRYGGW